MPESLPPSVGMHLRDRHALLWTCQVRDLVPGAEPHDYSVDETAAALRYRLRPDQLDLRVASLYWEAAWLEGAASPLLPALRTAAQAVKPEVRQIVVLAADDDASADLSSREFLPVCVLPGVLDPEAPAAIRYGAVRARMRKRTAWSLANRLEQYPGRVLVVLGARTNDDLDLLSEVLEDCPIVDLEVLLAWPPGAPPPDLHTSGSIVLHVWRGTEDDLFTAMDEAGAPPTTAVPQYTVRMGNRALALSARDVDRILGRFALLTEEHLAPPSTFTMQNLLAFLDGSLEDWSTYGVGLPVERDYRSQGRTLPGDVLATLRQVQEDSGTATTYVMRLPAEPGAGATTLLREAAYAASREGFPALVLRPEQIAIEFEDLLAFATTLSEGALTLGFEQAPPLLVVIDVDHVQRGITARSIASTLARHGRSVVVLHAVTAQEAVGEVERRGRRTAVLPVLRADLGNNEVERCQVTLSRIVEQWELEVAAPSLHQWQRYDQATRWLHGDNGPAETLFWVALRFFFTQGMAVTDAEQAESFLRRWITQRSEAIEDLLVRDILTYVAVMSTFRLPSPLWTVVRPAVGGTYPSELSAAIRQLGGIAAWGGAAKGLDEEVLRFLHPAVASAYLEHHAGARSPEERIQLLAPVLGALSPGSRADFWVAESLAKDVLAPKFEDRIQDWDWRLRTFELIPPAIRDQSKTVLHHWARSLYKSADQNKPRLEIGERLKRYESAVGKLERATSLPRRSGRDEVPSHLYNTLGTAFCRLAPALQEVGRVTDAEAAWDSACAAFEKAIDLSGGTNMEALLAFSRRLIEHAQAAGTKEQVVKALDATQALELLDEADDVAANNLIPDPTWTDQIAISRAQAFSLLDEELGESYLDELISSADPELGYYCKARLRLRYDDARGAADALAILDDAERAGVQPRSRTVRLRISLLWRQPLQQRDFHKLKELYRQLDVEPFETPRPLDLFRYAVLCYQTGDYSEGAERFRQLRAQFRGDDLSGIRMYDIWRDSANPEQAQLTQMRVDRRITEWRAQGYLLDLHQTVPFRPRHFSPPPDRGQVVTCAIRFESNGPLAVPPRFVSSSIGDRRQAPPTAL
ncbi:hypothetical protein ACWEOG_15070 [Amycolatopsis japonica]